MKPFFFAWILVSLLSCSKKKDTPAPAEFTLSGTWDCHTYHNVQSNTTFNQPPYNLILNYEQGFKILNDTGYCSRRALKNPDETYVFSNDMDHQGHWKIKGDTIVFSVSGGSIRYKFEKITNTEIKFYSTNIYVLKKSS